MDLDTLLGNCGFKQYKLFDPGLIVIDPQVRVICEQNACRQYGTNHMCPPAIKGIEAWKADIASFKNGIIVTKVYPLKRSSDFKSMLAGMADFQKTLNRFKKDILAKFGDKKILLLGAGSCRICERCNYADGEPCRFPDKAFPSLEACGIDVMSLSKQAGVNYHNEKNTVTYIGAVLY